MKRNILAAKLPPDLDWAGLISLISKANAGLARYDGLLQGIIEQSKENTDKASRIRDLYNTMKQEVVEATRSQYALATLDALFARPIFKPGDFIDQSKIPKRTAATILNQLEKKGIIKEIRKAVGRRSAAYGFTELIDIAEGNRLA